MAFLILGILLLALKLAEFGPVATWSWWVVLLPFGLATAWWGFCRFDRPDPAPRDGRRWSRPRPSGAAATWRRWAWARAATARRAGGRLLGIRCRQARRQGPDHRRRRRSSLKPQSNLSSTAPLLALLAFFANLASTPRV